MPRKARQTRSVNRTRALLDDEDEDEDEYAGANVFDDDDDDGRCPAEEKNYDTGN